MIRQQNNEGNNLEPPISAWGKSVLLAVLFWGWVWYQGKDKTEVSEKVDYQIFPYGEPGNHVLLLFLNSKADTRVYLWSANLHWAETKVMTTPGRVEYIGYRLPADEARTFRVYHYKQLDDNHPGTTRLFCFPAKLVVPHKVWNQWGFSS